MTSQPVHPLRIQKSTPNTSPVKMGSSIPRALTELAPTERRQNSPSYNQGSPKKMAVNMDSSPFQSSPFNASEGNSSPRLFWQGRDPATPNRFNSENGIFGKREMSPSPTRRSSIERLQRASRVKNSNMFAREQKQEYDPTSIPNIERPLAKQIQGNAYGGQGLDGLRSEERGRAFGHGRAPSKDIVSPYSPTKLPLTSTVVRESPTKDQTSPMKSSLATTRFGSKFPYDEDKISSPEYSGGEHELPEGRSLHRHAKSVTFDAAPQINEYEMVTPDLSSVGTNSRENSYDSAEDDEEESYNRSGSLELDDSFDASLEDTDKTPVVGPDDWRFSNTPSNGGSSDPFGAQLEPSSPLTGSEISSPTVTRNISADHRPLPPLPGATEKRNSGLFAAAERASNVTRGTAVPAASFSKTDIQGLAGGRMPLEERLRLMMIQDDDKAKPVAETQRERRMRRGGARDRCSATPEVDDGEIKIHEDEDTLADLGDYQLPERVSRESILRKVNGHDAFTLDSEYNFSSPPPSSRLERTTAPDPDVAIPSTEDVTIADDDDSSVIIKPEEEDSEIDVYDIPEMYQGRPESRVEDYDINNSVVRDDHNGDEDLDSQYSDDTPQNKSPELESNNAPEDEGPPTPRLTAPTSDIPSVDTENKEDQASLPALPGFLDSNSFGLSLQSYMTPTPPPPPPKDETSITSEAVIEPLEAERTSTPPGTPAKYALPKPDYDGAGWGSETEEEVGTPESVVHHAVSYEESPPAESPIVPEQTATIKSSSGSKLKTRPSATPSDIMAMREARRQISTEYPIPPIPQRHRNRPSQSMERDLEDPEVVSENEGMKRIPSLKRDGLTLDIGGDLGLSLDQDFDRLIEAQKVAFNLSHYHLFDSQGYHGQVSTLQAGALKFEEIHANVTPRKQRGYLMRQNTKVVVASSGTDVEAQNFRDTRSAGNSPVKQPRPQSWTVEPWNGSPRKRSTRDSTGGRKRMPPGPAPPLPGQQSNVAGLGMVAEDAQVDVSEPDNGERGRLFVKVIGVKDLGLPLPKNERTWFALTLDNGVHCVTTAWLELGKNAPIGQEFELVVPNELEFQLTLNAKLQKPPPQRVVESPTKAKAQKPSTFSRVFTSPKKRKELEMRQKEEQQRAADKQQSEMAAKRMSQQPTAWDLLSPLAADDGSFGRSYVCLKDHEQHCFGRPYVVDVNCFNEWATEEVGGMSSVKSKTGATQTRRRAPYKVGKLELQLLFVPKPKGASDDDIPKSMNSCIRAMKEAEEAVARCHNGYLSQQGGDCPYWRRRMFKLNGSKLTAYHESTGQPRATINLANASKLIDDRRALTQKETTGRGGSRRKSGFAEEEEGYMFVEEGFRIRFGNGEVIDFYADTAKDKEGWMKVLDQCIGTSSETKNGVSWCDMVLKREDSLKRKEVRKASGEKPPRFHARTKSMII
ncbi:hypothetical protein VE00_03876 [Pseudogymnoascus sp. WSF 3629]|nr:hypothetical protein VE00_03876 [Pseudogymnoascus sp. WSF 3629]